MSFKDMCNIQKGGYRTMKRRLAMILALTMGITALTGCGGADSGTGDNAPAQSNTESTAQESEESAPESS